MDPITKYACVCNMYARIMFITHVVWTDVAIIKYSWYHAWELKTEIGNDISLSQEKEELGMANAKRTLC